MISALIRHFSKDLFTLNVSFNQGSVELADKGFLNQEVSEICSFLLNAA